MRKNAWLLSDREKLITITRVFGLPVLHFFLQLLENSEHAESWAHRWSSVFSAEGLESVRDCWDLPLHLLSYSLGHLWKKDNKLG